VYLEVILVHLGREIFSPSLTACGVVRKRKFTKLYVLKHRQRTKLIFRQLKFSKSGVVDISHICTRAYQLIAYSEGTWKHDMRLILFQNKQ